MRRSFVSLALALALGVALVTACGDSDEVAESVPTPPERPPNAQIELESEDGSKAVINTGTTLPDGFPKDAVPIPIGATIASFVTEGGDAVGSYTLHLEVGDASQATTAYRTQLEQAGYTIAGELENVAGGATFQGFEATKSPWYLTVISAREPGSNKSMMVLNVAPDEGGAE